MRAIGPWCNSGPCFQFRLRLRPAHERALIYNHCVCPLKKHQGDRQLSPMDIRTYGRLNVSPRRCFDRGGDSYSLCAPDLITQSPSLLSSLFSTATGSLSVPGEDGAPSLNYLICLIVVRRSYCSGMALLDV